MQFTEKVTPLILTFNEITNISRTLDPLSWAARIVVVDSFSTDGTWEHCCADSKISGFQRAFDTAANQDNFGLAQVESEWVLSLDADYVLSDALVRELQRMPSDPPFDGYWIDLKYCIYGKPLRSSILPPRCSLYRRSKAAYYDDGHTQRVRIEGPIGALRNPIYHDDRKPLNRWIQSQIRYSERESIKLSTTPSERLKFTDRLRKLKFVAPPLVFAYTLLIKGGVLDGWHGLYYAFQRALAEAMLSLRLIERQNLKIADSTLENMPR